MMLSHEDRTRTQTEVYEIVQPTVSRIEYKYSTFRTSRDVSKSTRPSISERKLLDVILYLEDTSLKPSKEIALENEIAASLARRMLKNINVILLKLF